MALWIHAWSTFAMTGLIWFVQIVHYPLMEAYERRWFSEHARRHARLTGYVAIPIMTLELFTGIYLLATLLKVNLVTLGLMLIVLIWISTFAVQVPLHAKLQSKYDPGTLRQLIFSNWVRTWLWTLRSVFLLVFLISS